jgi:glycosyltransferase involved in cell wall biosynthesis
LNAKAGEAHVVIAYKYLPQYRLRFFSRLREELASTGIRLTLVHGQPSPREALRSDTRTLDWAVEKRNRVFSIGRHELIWQPCLRLAANADLVIVEQASRLLVNYVLMALQACGAAKVAFWGHGENLQRHRAHRIGESVKRLVSRYPHWWFAYTEPTKARVERLGYPRERITVVQNAIDTYDLEAACRNVGGDELAAFRRRHELGNGPLGIFVGGLYLEKRLQFLLEASDVVAARLPDFRLLIIGDGPERQHVVAQAAEREHVRYLGPLFDHEKVVALAASSAMLMPGVVGLAVLDAFAARTPMITSAVDYHSPEIDYLVDGYNGIVAPDPNALCDYADRVVDVLTDAQLQSHLVTGCADAAATFTNEAMVSRFAEGVRAALQASRGR